MAGELISVIIPNYNHADYLEKRIDSVLAQDYDRFEVIILDDASDDNSKEIIDAYRDHPKVRVVVFAEHNSGNTFVQWKKGLQLAKGDIVWIAESDDYAHPDFLKVMSGHMQQSERTGIVFSNSYRIDDKGQVHGDWSSWYDELNDVFWKKGGALEGKRACCEFLTLKNIIPNVSAVLFRKKFLEAAVDEYMSRDHFELAGDWFIYSLILLKADLYYEPERLNYYREHSGTVRKATQALQIKTESIRLRRFMLKTFPLSKEQRIKLFRKFYGETYWFLKNKAAGRPFFKLLYLFKILSISPKLFFFVIKQYLKFKV